MFRVIKTESNLKVGNQLSGQWTIKTGQTALLGFAALLLFACAPSVSFQQLKPGRFDLGKDMVFAVGQVDMQPELSLTRKKSKKTIRKLAYAVNDIADKYLIGPDVLRSDVESRMISAISGNAFARYSNEQPTYTINLSGKFSARDSSQHKKEEQKKKDGKVEVREYDEVLRDYRLDLNYEIMAIAKASLAGRGKVSRQKQEAKTGKTEKEASEQFNDWDEVARGMISEAVSGIMKEILPHHEKVRRTLKKGASDQVNNAVKIAQNGDLETAGQAWQRLLDRKDSLAPLDKTAVYHNLGVYYEFRDELEQAAIAFGNCALEQGDKMCAEGLGRVKARDIELQRLRQAGV